MAIVGPSETATGEASEMFVGADDNYAFAHLPGLHPRDDGGGSAPINDEVGLLGLGPKRDAGEEEDREAEFERHAIALNGVSRAFFTGIIARASDRFVSRK